MPLPFCQYNFNADTDGGSVDAYTYTGTLKVKGERISGTAGTPGTLIIRNESTKQEIELNLQNAENTTEVTVDIPNRKIYSQDNKNLIHHLAPTSFLSDFWLKKVKMRFV